MRKLVFFSAVILLFNIPQIIHAGWTRSYGTDKNDYAWSVDQTSDGGYIVTGTINNSGINRGGDLWLFRLNSEGDTAWTKVYGDSNNLGDFGQCVKQTSDGGYIITGSKDYYDHGYGDVWILKTDAEGDTQWTTTCHIDTFSSYGNDVMETSDGYVVTGASKTYRWVEGEPGGWVPLERYDLLLIKATKSGAISWIRRFGGEMGGNTTLYEGNAVIQTDDQGYLVAGNSGSACWYYSIQYLYLLKTDKDGIFEWSKTYESSYGSKGLSIDHAEGNNYIVGGSPWTLLKVEESGDTIWTRYLGLPGNRIQRTTDGGVIIMGLRYGEDNIMRTALMKTDASGDSIWSRDYGEDSIHITGVSMQQTQDKGYVVAGYAYSVSDYNREAVIFKTDSLGHLGVTEQVAPFHSSFVISSPIGSRVVVSYKDMPEGFHASVYDASGRKVDELHSAGKSGTLSWGACYGPGVYFIVPEDKRGLQPVKVVLVR